MKMTDEQAIEILEEVKELDDSMFQFNPSYMEALDYVIQKMKSCKDAISRQSVLELFEKYHNQNFSYEIVLSKIMKLPSVNPPHKHFENTINIDKKIVYRFFCLSPMKKREILREFPSVSFDIDNDDAEDLLYQLDRQDNMKELFWNKLCQIG